ncbi:family 43 glycosylhydrolase [Chitinophaga oryziterrae]|nr:family 43 glycosylhydrolase [Chitinophaga oryziterrae]
MMYYNPKIPVKSICLCLVLGMLAPAMAQQASKKKPVKHYSAYLFAYFTGAGKDAESIRFAISNDGYNYKALNNNMPVINSAQISTTGGVRDPHILRGTDGKTFYMVATDLHVVKDGWGPNQAMVLLKSKDLVNWNSHIVNIAERFPGLSDVSKVWAPQTIFDSQKKKYMIYWSMSFGKGPIKIYYAYANPDFTGLETTPKQLFFSPDSTTCLDADIIFKDGKYHLFMKATGKTPGIKEAVSDKLTEGYVLSDKRLEQTDEEVEGSGVFKLNNSDTWILMYDLFKKGKYQFTESKDLENFKVIDNEISMNFHPRHGTVIPITAKEAQVLTNKWPSSDERATHNPVLKGYYADPDILYAEKTGKFYIYPTSDGFDNWSGTYFKTFSSKDLTDWKDEGVILDLGKDVSWAKKNAWAPCIIERKINGKYKYFYYFTAAQKIGVAVADDPTGPFVDSGKPLIDKYPEGVTRGQQIDPDVFSDPKTGKNYLYWGNGYMAAAELNDDMVSLKPGTTKILTPAASYNEGSYVIYRNGIYYFMWSENDTRSEDYQVHYGMSDSPQGKINLPENNLVIAKDKTAGIYGTGHHAIIQIPGKDEWYIVYHRFKYPEGITMGSAAGYNREVCIDKLEFNNDGTIKQVTPTHEGVKAINKARQ